MQLITIMSFFFFFSSLPKGTALLRTGGFLSHGNTERGKNGPGFYFNFFCPLQESQANKSPEQIYHFSFSPTPSFSFLLYFFKIGLEQDGWFPRPGE